EIDLKGRWLLVVKPPVYVSTKDAFSGVKPTPPAFDLRFLTYLPLEEWRGKVVNDFESTVFPKYPELSRVKESLYEGGAVYSSMSGSGSSIYGIFSDETSARECYRRMQSTDTGVWLFKL
ncbi:MAG: 4-(cytidine 5'-diphospho)-2-C-methyl-D-erythritol kinase, partial [Muribaculaceae bacterium]|nr:4-(cytidine 5'-diphospho)-2-C-methyl-D-erythritol kinase [Muribaculaceae bacterium]